MSYVLERILRLESSLPSGENRAVVTKRAIGIAYPGLGEVLVVDGYGETILHVKTANPTSIALSETGGLVAVGSHTGALSLYTVAGTAKWVEDLAEKGGVLSLSMSPENMLAVGTATGGLIVYDETGLVEWSQGRGAWVVGSREPVYCSKWSPQGDRLLAGSGGKAYMYSSSGDRLWEKKLGKILAAAWSPDGGRVAVATSDGTLLVLDSEKGGLVSERRLYRRIYALSWMSSEEVIVGASTRSGGKTYGSIEVVSAEGQHLWSTCDIPVGPIRSLGPAPPLPVEAEYLALPSPLREVYGVKRAPETPTVYCRPQGA